MKIKIDDEVDALYITFNDSEIVERIQLELEINANIDANNKLVGLEVLPYSILRQWANDLLEENNLVILQETEIPFYMHCGYEMVFFRIEDIDKEDVVCTYYLEEGAMERDTVREFLQSSIDFNLGHRKLRSYISKQ